MFLDEVGVESAKRFSRFFVWFVAVFPVFQEQIHLVVQEIAALCN